MHNPFDETRRASCLRENFTSSSYGEGLETDGATTHVPRQSLTPGMLLARVSCNLWPFRFPTSVSGFWVVAFEHLLDALDRALQFVDQIFIGSGEQIGQ
jgi:hypothetical protein